jgi:hypothetical protein
LSPSTALHSSHDHGFSTADQDAAIGRPQKHEKRFGPCARVMDANFTSPLVNPSASWWRISALDKRFVRFNFIC